MVITLNKKVKHTIIIILQVSSYATLSLNNSKSTDPNLDYVTLKIHKKTICVKKIIFPFEKQMLILPQYTPWEIQTIHIYNGNYCLIVQHVHLQ